MTTFTELLEQAALVSLEKQFILVDLIGNLDWRLDMDAGTIRFGRKYNFPAQILGSEAARPPTWLWSWANEASAIPAGVTRRAIELRELGQREQIPELTTPQLRLEQLDGTQIALVACGLFQAAGYYRGPYEGGAVFVLLDAPSPRPVAALSAMKLMNAFAQVITTLPVNHRRVFQAYAEHKHHSYRMDESEIEMQLATGEVMHAQFDDSGRLAGLRTAPGAPPSGNHAAVPPGPRRWPWTR